MDKRAQKLLEKFVAEKLDGDLERILDFDFGTLRDSREFGCSGRGFDAANTRIMHAVYALLWGDLLPELTFDGCRRKRVLIKIIGE